MSTTSERAAPAPPRSSSFRTAVGWLMLGCFALLVVIGLAVGERESTYDDLRDAVAAHHVGSVRVDRPELPGGRRVGESTPVVVHWRHWLVPHAAIVTEVPRQRGALAPDAGNVRRVDSVGRDLRSLDDSVQVDYADRASLDGLSHATLDGWWMPSWTAGVAMVAVVGTFLLLIAAPTPWRANRWAWFWGFVLAAPLGQVAFLVLGNPTGLFPPRHPGRRVRGGRGFLLALAVSLVGTVALTSVGLAG